MTPEEANALGIANFIQNKGLSEKLRTNSVGKEKKIINKLGRGPISPIAIGKN